jgi:hypothetical protein
MIIEESGFDSRQQYRYICAELKPAEGPAWSPIQTVAGKDVFPRW